MKRLFVLLACLLAVPAQGQILSIIMGGTNQPAATPTFSPVAGAVANPTTVTASTSTSDGCTIYFDTSNPPVTAQTTYSVTTGVTLYAQARGCAHHTDSQVGSATYTISGPLTIAHDADSNSGSCGDVATCSWNHTIAASPAGPDLWVACSINYGDNGVSSIAATYNSVAMTQVQTKNTGGVPYIQVWLFHLFSPATGTHSVNVTINGGSPTVGTSSPYQFYCGAVSFTGASGTALDNSGSNALVTSNTPGLSLTTAHANAWIVNAVYPNTEESYTFGPNSPLVSSLAIPNYGAQTLAIAYQGPVVTPGATANTWLYGSSYSGQTVLVNASIKPGP